MLGERLSYRRGGRWLAARALLLAAALTVAPGAARGQNAGADVEAIMRHGVELRRQGHDADALAEFQRALQMQQTPRIQAQVALAEQALGLWAAAETDLLAALADTNRGDAWIKKNRPALDKALATIQGQLGTLEVWGTPAGATVYVNGKPVGTLPLARPVRVAGESVVLSVRAAGHLDSAPRALRVPVGQTVREHVELVAASPAQTTRDSPDPGVASATAARQSSSGVTAAAGTPIVIGSPDSPEPSRSPLRPLAWVTGAVAAGALAFGVIETVARSRDKDAFDNYVWPNPSDPAHPVPRYCGTTAIPAECQPLKDAFDRSATLMIVGYGAGAALAAGSIALFVISTPGRERSPDRNVRLESLACVPDPTHHGLSCLLRF